MTPLLSLLSKQAFIVLDGGLATELEARGADLKDPLWSAKLLTSNPDLIHQVHYDYFIAGADVAVTASYQASFQGLEARGFTKDQSRSLIQSSVHLAQKAKAEILRVQPSRQLLIAGSVGPYGAFLANGAEYRGDYELPAEDMKAFHRSRIEALVDAGVDVLALETMPSISEIRALLQLLAEFPGVCAWVSCTVRDEEHLSDGTPLSLVVEMLDKNEQVVALGVNCIPEADVAAVLTCLEKLTSKPLVAYPNSGEIWDADEKVWRGRRVEGQSLEERVRQWRDRGARLIGGCCRTGPEDVRRIRECLNS